MPAPPTTPRELIDRLDSRHEELIHKLDELNARIEATLAEFARARDPAAAQVALDKAA
jgi:C4-dicarboxylate-specific signal transduction histidine kinase